MFFSVNLQRTVCFKRKSQIRGFERSHHTDGNRIRIPSNRLDSPDRTHLCLQGNMHLFALLVFMTIITMTIGVVDKYIKLRKFGIFQDILSLNFISEFLSLEYIEGHICLKQLLAAFSMHEELGNHFVRYTAHSYFLKVGTIRSIYVYLICIVTPFHGSMEPISEISLLTFVCSFATNPLPC